RQCQEQGPDRTWGIVAAGSIHWRVRPFQVNSAERSDPGPRRSLDDGRLCNGKFLGAIDHHQRDARPCDEYLQLRLPWRHADGKFGSRVAGAAVQRASDPSREWLAAYPGCSLFLFRAKKSRGTLTGNFSYGSISLSSVAGPMSDRMSFRLPGLVA